MYNITIIINNFIAAAPLPAAETSRTPPAAESSHPEPPSSKAQQSASCAGGIPAGSLVSSLQVVVYSGYLSRLMYSSIVSVVIVGYIGFFE